MRQLLDNPGRTWSLCARPLNTSQICFAFCSRPNDAVDQVMNILMFVTMKQQVISISQHTSSAALQTKTQSGCAMPGQAPRHISIMSSLPFPGLWGLVCSSHVMYIKGLVHVIISPDRGASPHSIVKMDQIAYRSTAKLTYTCPKLLILYKTSWVMLSRWCRAAPIQSSSCQA